MLTFHSMRARGHEMKWQDWFKVNKSLPTESVIKMPKSLLQEAVEIQSVNRLKKQLNELSNGWILQKCKQFPHFQLLADLPKLWVQGELFDKQSNCSGLLGAIIKFAKLNDLD